MERSGPAAARAVSSPSLQLLPLAFLLSDPQDSHVAPLQRFSPAFLLMRLRHATTAQDDASEARASAFVQGSDAADADSAAPINGGGRDVDAFVREFKEMRKVYHKRVMWGERWQAGEVAWPED